MGLDVGVFEMFVVMEIGFMVDFKKKIYRLNIYWLYFCNKNFVFLM